MSQTQVSQSSGLATKMGRVFSGSDLQHAYEEATQKLRAKAELDRGLISDGEANIRAFLTGFLRKFGIVHLTVTFQ